MNHNAEAICTLTLADGLSALIRATPVAKTIAGKYASIQDLKLRASKSEMEIIITTSGELDLVQYKLNVVEIKELKITRHYFLSDGRIICEIVSTDDDLKTPYTFVEIAYPIYLECVNRGGLPLHAGAIMKDKIAIALAGNSGSGKTTCCHKVPQPWVSPCDDEILLVRQNNEFRMHPLATWSEYLVNPDTHKAWTIETHYTIKQIVFLEKSESDEIDRLEKADSALKIAHSAMHVFARLIGSVYKKDTYLKKKIFENAWEIASEIPVLQIKHALDGKFWELLDH